MCTPWASDSVVPAPDWAGLEMFSGEWRIIRGERLVRVPPRAQCFRRSGAVFGPLTVLTVSTTLGVSRAVCSCRWPFLWPIASFPGLVGFSAFCYFIAGPEPSDMTWVEPGSELLRWLLVLFVALTVHGVVRGLLHDD
jgi:hypothetical protein